MPRCIQPFGGFVHSEKAMASEMIQEHRVQRSFSRNTAIILSVQLNVNDCIIVLSGKSILYYISTLRGHVFLDPITFSLPSPWIIL